MSDAPKPLDHLESYVSLPKTIRAVFYDGSNSSAVKKLCAPHVEIAPTTSYIGTGGDQKEAPRLWVGTLNGAVCVSPMTWIVYNGAEAYPVDEVVFAERYRRVE
jgi:hypothetical protein